MPFSIKDNGGGQYYTAEEAALTLRVDIKTIYRKIKAGQVPTRRFGRRYLIPASFVEGKLEE